MISVEPAIDKFHLPPSLVKWRMSSRGQEEGRGGALTAVASVTSGSTVISTFMLPATVSRMLSDRASYNWKHTEALYHINLQGLQILWMLLMSLFSWVWPVQGLVLFSQDSRWRWARLVFPVWERGGRGQVVGADSSIDTRHPTLWTQPSNFPDTSSLRRKGPGIIVSSIKSPFFQHRRSWAVL